METFEAGEIPVNDANEDIANSAGCGYLIYVLKTESLKYRWILKAIYFFTNIPHFEVNDNFKFKISKQILMKILIKYEHFVLSWSTWKLT